MLAKQFSEDSTEQKTNGVAEWLLEKKAGKLLALDLSKQSAPVEAVIIVSATSVRHAQGLADYVLQNCKERRYEYLSMEGYATGSWILLDLNDLVVHIFQSENRELFRLDDLWPSARVLMDAREGG